jgi:hypothetical protein
MPQFTDQNTEGYSAEDLKTLNLRFEARCNMLLAEYKEDDDIREQVMKRWAEEILEEFDNEQTQREIAHMDATTQAYNEWRNRE